MGRGFEATVELLLPQPSDRGGNESVNEVNDASVIIISADDESPALKRARRKSHEKQGASVSAMNGRRSQEELEEGVALSGSERRCLEELQGVVAAVSGVIGSSSSSSSSKGDPVLQRIAR